ncbi:hypothetical protein ACTFIY_006570 [Dictyostelium cf. discoideum]
MELDDNLLKKCEYMNEKIPCFLVIKGDNKFFQSKQFLINDDEVEQILELYKQTFIDGQLLSINNIAFSVDENDVENKYFCGKNDFDDIIHLKATKDLEYIFIVIVKSNSELKQKEIFELAHNLFEVKTC